jgi:hypothetical protein
VLGGQLDGGADERAELTTLHSGQYDTARSK